MQHLPAVTRHALPTASVRERLLRVIAGIALVFAGVAAFVPAPAQAARIKELAAIQGVRPNQLSGLGLIVGLDGTGDQSMAFTSQGLATMLQQMGLTLPPGTTVQPKNVAMVTVTASLPAFAQPGQTIDVTVSSLGTAKSLRGGTLVATSLKGLDGQVYAIAQGNLVIGGAGASAGGSKVQINQLSSGRIPDGATVERAVPTPFGQGDSVQFDLKTDDFNTAREVVKVINAKMGAGTAQALDGRVVKVRMPEGTDARVAFVAEVENLNVERATPAAKVVINARTGSIVMNKAVTLAACAVAHGNLSVTINTTPMVSQPNALSSGGTTQVVEKSDITIKQDAASLISIGDSTQLADVVKALNSLGATPQDLISILQAIKSAGALNAELEVI